MYEISVGAILNLKHIVTGPLTILPEHTVKIQFPDMIQADKHTDKKFILTRIT